MANICRSIVNFLINKKNLVIDRKMSAKLLNWFRLDSYTNANRICLQMLYILNIIAITCHWSMELQSVNKTKCNVDRLQFTFYAMLCSHLIQCNCHFCLNTSHLNVEIHDVWRKGEGDGYKLRKVVYFTMYTDGIPK